MDLPDEKVEKRILYIGNVGQVGTALTVHAQNMGRLFQSIGYDVSFACDRGTGNIFPAKHEGFNYTYTKNYIKIPKVRAIEWMLEEILGLKLFRIVKQNIKKQNPNIVILYGYSIEKQLIKICKKKDIPLIVERVDWFEKDDRNSLFAKSFLQTQVDIAFKKNDFKVDGVIAISEYLFGYFKKNGQTVTFIPPIFNFDQSRLIIRENNNKINLVYAGSLGGTKDQIFPVIKALEKINCEEVKISLDIVGISIDELKSALRYENYKFHGIQTYGRLSNEETKGIVKNADFSLLLRHNKRYAKAGFSTKFAESMSLGVPVICTKVGGADNLITDMVDGIHLADNETNTIYEKLMELQQLSNEEILEMKNNAFHTACKNFHIDNYKNQIVDFINKVTEKIK